MKTLNIYIIMMIIIIIISFIYIRLIQKVSTV